MSGRIKNFLGRNFNKTRTPDKLSVSCRSALMSKIKSKKTRFETLFICELKKKSPIVFKTNVSAIRGKPDVVFLKKKVCVFLDSDFWHGWQYPRWKHLLKNDFWRNKIEANRKRDLKTSRYLKRRGWKVLRVWEHVIKLNLNAQRERILRSLAERNG